MQHRKKFAELIRDKGYYIVLALCAIAVGVSGYLFCKNLAKEESVSSISSLHGGSGLAAAPEKLPPKPELPVIAGEDAVQTVKEDKPPAPTEPAAPAVQTPQPFRLTQPLEGEVAQSFAMDHLSYNDTMKDWRTHAGIDILCKDGSPVRAAADGVVDAVYSDDFLGWTVTVRHEGGFVTHYSNLAQQVAVSAGDSVEAGQELGTVGASALGETAEPPHLHFALYRDNVPQDPTQFLEG